MITFLKNLTLVTLIEVKLLSKNLYPMKILVCISSVPDTTTKITFTDNDTQLNKQGVQFIINPYDEFSLSKALKLKAELGGTVTVINVGTAENDPVIRKSLAIGADDALRIDVAPIDGMHVANEIANYAKDKGYDLILTGRESIDFNGGVVPHLLGELLGIPSVSPCVNLTVNGSTIELETLIDGGKETLTCSTPAVIGGQKGLVLENELIIPNMRGIMQSRTKPLTVATSASSESAQKVTKLEQPAAKSGCKIVDAANVDELVDLLQNEAKVI